MSVWGRRGTYGATAFVVTFFVVLSTVAYLAEPFIEKEENVTLKNSDSDFLRMARFQSVQWREWGPESIAEAKRKDKPIFLVAGMPWGAMRERFDGLFSVSEVAEYLNQEFVCVRVDSLADPSWRVTPAPIARSLRDDPADFFMGVFTAEGEVLGIPDKGEMARMSDVVFLAYLSERLKEFAERNESAMQGLAIEEVVDLRGGVSSASTDADDYINATERRLFSSNRLLPYEMELLLDEGRIEPVARMVDRLLGSTATDLLWGGFFENWDPATGEVLFTKSAFSNSGMLRLLVRLAVETGEPRYLGAAKWQFDYVLRRYGREVSSASDYAKLGDASRSDYFSFSRTRLNEILTPEEHERAIRELGMVSGANIQAMPRMVDLDGWVNGCTDVQGLLKKMRKAVTKPERMQGQMVSFEAQAEAIRSLIFSARMLGDMEKLGLSLEAFQGLKSRMRIGVDDVSAGPGLQPSNEVGLGTYLAYSGAAWEALVSSGDMEIGWDGAQVLRRSLFLYRDERDSLWSGSISDFDEDWRKVMPPPVFDGSIRSGMGELIRLCNLYGSWRGSRSHRADFIHGRDRALSQSSWVLSETPVNLGTLARAVRQVNRGVAVGFEGPVDWAYWEKNHPGVPLVPVSENGPAGYRFLKFGKWTGPHTVEELTDLLR